MTHQESIDNKTIRFVKAYWPVVVFIFGLGVLYSSLNSADASQEKDIQALQARQAAIDAGQTTIITQLSQIQVDIEWLKKNIK